ncbi:MAG: helix-turn-helix transcriptional regulator [Corallococcus sp.]|nr:helix-turn-helix transcriptional regulator [Corallococcus sp.]
MLDLQAVGENIRSLRIKNGLSQDYIAELLGVSHQAVSRWENGLAVPSVDNIAELCEVFDVSFEQLLCLNGKIEWNSKDIFKGHSRMFVVKQIISGAVRYDIAGNFDAFMPQERLMILKAVKERRIEADISVLSRKLTPDEQRFMGGKK